ncbi:MAG: FtsH protease activity modulator HflK [Firmicutes bacterium HGW-Firmicutes-3]|jgi:membrane protease subunit HflK|nr:MAG: FtsH protease activity modulator HflK [Firmicutes bacterium HGW-Firmicutes-3]
MKTSKIILAIMAVVIIAMVLVSSVYMLDNAEAAVVQRLGKLHRVETKAGLNFKVPLIDTIQIVNTNEIYSLQYGYRSEAAPTTTEAATYRNVENESIVLTSGSYLIDLGAVIQFRITDPAAYIYEVDDVEGTVRLAFESVLRSNIQNQLLDEALINKDSIAQEIMPDLARKINSYNVGITITEVRLTDVLLPKDVQFAYDDVNIASNEKDALRSQATRYSNEMLPKARADAYQMIQGAEAYKAEKVAQARGDVENFNQVYERYAVAKDITRTRLYIETMEKVLSSVDQKFVIDLDNDNVLKFLPLDVRGGE